LDHHNNFIETLEIMSKLMLQKILIF